MTPATGLISDTEFTGGDVMLKVIHLQRQDKEDKKPLKCWGIGKDKDKDKGRGRERQEGEVSMLDIKYKKHGWDMSKEGF